MDGESDSKASEISKIGYSRCKKWRIIENSEIESDL